MGFLERLEARAAAVGGRVLIGRMANPVREREALIMETIFAHHPTLATETVNPQRLGADRPDVTIEGGDVMVAREDVLLIGIGQQASRGVRNGTVVDMAAVETAVRNAIHAAEQMAELVNLVSRALNAPIGGK